MVISQSFISLGNSSTVTDRFRHDLANLNKYYYIFFKKSIKNGGIK